MARSVIVSAVRTPFAKLGGALVHRPGTELGAIVIRAALDRAGVENDEVEYVIMGQVLQGGAGQAPARQASIGAGLPAVRFGDRVVSVPSVGWAESGFGEVELHYSPLWPLSSETFTVVSAGPDIMSD